MHGSVLANSVYLERSHQDRMMTSFKRLLYQSRASSHTVLARSICSEQPTQLHSFAHSYCKPLMPHIRQPARMVES